MPRLETKRYRCSAFGRPCDFPALSAERQPHRLKSTIADYEGLFIDYGYRETSYPYTQQNDYTDEAERDVPVAVLENELLYAEFLPTLGGRLWRLYDKKRQRDVLYTNDVIRFRNLSVRNAWFSGGVEWNCGVIGHSPFTCSQMYCAAVTGKNGEDVLRFYEFERVRGIYYQMDFWLEKDRLMVAVRIENPNEQVVPMYWWSNMATPEYKGGRVAVPAVSAYNNSDGMGIKKSAIPYDGGRDVSYPENIPDTIDYFYDIAPQSDKFIVNADAQGFGLLQFSSNHLKGRKLFPWGHRKGSHHWQRMLTDRAGDYVEIQAGLGKTQYECLPMPPKTTWAFLECYTLSALGAAAMQGGYEALVTAAEKQVQSLGGSAGLDSRLQDVLRDISLQTGELLLAGSGWGAPEQQLGGQSPAHLEFCADDDVTPWMELLSKKPLSAPLSFAYGARQEALLLENADLCEWSVPYQLGLLCYDRREFEKAKVWCEKSLLLDSNPKNQHLYAFVLYQLKDAHFSYFVRKALLQNPNDYGLCESLFSLLLHAEDYASLIESFPQLSGDLQGNARLCMYLAVAYLGAGDAKRAEEILLSDGGLQLRDYREGDRMLDTLYRGIRKALYCETDAQITVPEQFDFIVADFGGEKDG